MNTITKLISSRLFIALVAILATEMSSAQINVESSIKEVTVYSRGAEINRTAQVNLKSGTQDLILKGLSSDLDPKSIKVSISDVSILSVEPILDYLTDTQKDKEITDITNRRDDAKAKLDQEQASLKVIQQEQDILLANKNVGGNSGVKAEELKALMTYFGTRLQELSSQEIAARKRVEDASEKLQKLQDQLGSMQAGNEKKTNTIAIRLQTDKPGNRQLSIHYVVTHAGWFPSYDLHAGNPTEPVKMTYKALIYQQSGIDWKDVKISLSSGNLSAMQSLPDLTTYYLQFVGGIRPLVSNYSRRNANGIQEIKGRVYDAQTGKGIPYAAICLDGFSIGTLSDDQGNYSLQLPADAGSVSVNYPGYPEFNTAIYSSNLDIPLSNAVNRARPMAMPSAAGNMMQADEVVQEKQQIAFTTEQHPTNFQYNIQLPYSVPGNGKGQAVELMSTNVPATYVYKAIPKLSNKAFLTANISGWDQLNLLDGEANLYLDDAYVGRTALDTRYTSDTLSFSLGQDNSVVIKREKVKDYAQKHFLGSKKTEQRGYTISIRNTKSGPIQILVYDQIPVSKNDQIKVTANQLSGGKLDPETGQVTWNLKIDGGKSKVLDLRYEAEYPKDKQINLE